MCTSELAGRRPSTYVVIAGPDGSGKSTMACQVVACLRQKDLAVVHLHVDPTRDAAAGPPDSAPHRKKPHAIPAGLLAVVGRWWNYRVSACRGNLGQRSHWIVQERGWLDQAVDPARYRLPKALGPMVRVLAPTLRKPDVTIMCNGDPAVISDRKGELPVTETRRQLLAWQQALSSGMNSGATVIIDTSRLSLDRSAALALGAVVDASLPFPSTRAMRRGVGASRRHELVAERGSEAAVRELIRPASRIGLLRRRVATAAVRLGIGPTPDGLPIPLDELLDGLGLAAHAVAFIRSHGRRRWVAAAVSRGRVAAFVKIEPSDSGRIEHETAMLSMVEGQIPGYRTPSAIGKAVHSGWAAVALVPIPISRSTLAADGWEAVEAAVALARARHGQGVTHGDLAPWNLLDGMGSPALVDWEDSLREFIPGHDLLHYLMRARILGPMPADPRQIQSWLQPGARFIERYAAELGLPATKIEYRPDLVAHGHD